MRRLVFVFTALVGLGSGCGSSESAVVCTAGASVACRCADDAPGVATCNDAGTAFEGCVCAPESATSSSAGSGGSGQGGAGGSSSPSSASSSSASTSSSSSSASSTSSSTGGGCTPGQMMSCYDGPAGTEGVGVCHGGTSTCGADGTWGGCDGEVLPSVEDCTTPADEDCNGVSETCPPWVVDAGATGGAVTALRMRLGPSQGPIVAAHVQNADLGLGMGSSLTVSRSFSLTPTGTSSGGAAMSRA